MEMVGMATFLPINDDAIMVALHACERFTKEGES